MNDNGMPSSFTKWAMGLFTVILIGFGTWTFTSINLANAEIQANRLYITRMQEDYRELKDDIKEIKETQNKILFMNKKEVIDEWRQEQAEQYGVELRRKR